MELEKQRRPLNLTTDIDWLVDADKADTTVQAAILFAIALVGPGGTLPTATRTGQRAKHTCHALLLASKKWATFALRLKNS